MKNVLALSLVVVSSLSAVACGGAVDSTGSDPSVATSVEETVDSVEVELRGGKFMAISGTWANPFPDDLVYDSETHATGKGGTDWKGGWVGSTTYTADYTFDASGNLHGTLQETFTGRYGKHSGTINFVDDITVSATDGSVHVGCRIVSGTGDFKGARGYVDFDGFLDLNTYTSSGTYSGRWFAPKIHDRH